MKFDDLCSIAHNVADSFGSGASLLFNYGFYPYDDAQRSHNSVLEVDFLTGTVLSGMASNELIERLGLAPIILAGLCARHGQSANAFASLRARYVNTATGRRYEVKVADHNGRTRTDHYDGMKGSKLQSGKQPPVASP